MRLFDTVASADMEPARYGESHYEYLCRTGRPRFLLVRELMKSWLAELCWTFSTLSDEPREPEFGRAPNGAFIGPKGPQNRNVSGVLLVSALRPWTVVTAEPAIYQNPWARNPTESFPESIIQFWPEGPADGPTQRLSSTQDTQPSAGLASFRSVVVSNRQHDFQRYRLPVLVFCADSPLCYPIY